MIYISPAKLIKSRLGDRSPPNWKMAILSFRDRKGSDGLMQAFQAKPIGSPVFYGQEAFAESPFVYEAIVDGQKIGVFARCIWGGPQAAILVEELAYLGIRFLIGYGSAGSIDPSLQLGQQVIASSAIPNDGTSRAYGQKERIYADPDLESLALQAGRNVGCELECVTVATVDALYRETEQAVSDWRKQGAQIINIEASTFYTVSRACGIKSIWLGHVADRLTEDWKSWFWNRDEATRLSEKICVELVRSAVLDTRAL